MGDVGSKSRSLGQIEGKSCKHFGCHIFWSECLSKLYLGQVRIWVILGQKQGQ